MTTSRSLLWFALLLAALSTAIGYRFASGNQLEQLPIILRQLDPTYLTGDPFVASSASIGPRIYFARLVAVLCQVMPLSWAYVCLRFLSDLALIAVTLWAARRVIGADRSGAMIAAVLTVVVSAIHLGDAAELRYDVFQPASLGIPGMLFAIALGLCGRPVAAGATAAITCLPHPLYGLYGGGIGLATGFAALALAAGPRGGLGNLRRALGWTAGGAFIFGAVLAVFWWLPSRGASPAPLSTDELFAILGHFRSPHHYLPSHFRTRDVVTLAAFAWASVLAFDAWRRAGAPPIAPSLLLVPVALVAAGCVAGVLFVEVWPLRAVLTLQPFRLLSVFKWLGFLLLAWLFSAWWRDARDPLSRTAALSSLVAAGATFPLVTATGVSIVQFKGGWTRFVADGVWIVLLILLTVTLSLAAGASEERLRLLTVLALLGVFIRASGRLPALAALLGVLMVVSLVASGNSRLAGSFAAFAPTVGFDGLDDVDAETARAAARQTPPEALFVVPPHLGILRVIGRRALVVDFEAVPFADQAMRAWRERIRDVYGETTAGGHAAREALDAQYHSVTDAHLLDLADRYGATHAVLYVDTPTRLPILYENATYRIAALGPVDRVGLPAVDRARGAAVR